MNLKSALCVLAVLSICGCSTVNSFVRMAPDYDDLPVEQVTAAARVIEQIVDDGQRDPQLEAIEGVNVNTPEILQAVRTRALRQPLVDEFLASGHAIEERSGLIAVLRTSAYKRDTTSRQRDRNALLVMSENENRWQIYEGLLDANNWSRKNLSALQEIFYRARVELMEAGQAYEGPDGQPALK